MLARNGGLSSAKLCVLIEQLTARSRFRRFMSGRPPLDEALLAGIFNILGAANSEKDTFTPLDLDDPEAAWYDAVDKTDTPQRDSADDSELDAMMRGELSPEQLN